MNNTSITGFRTRIERHYELAKRLLTPEEIAEAQRFEFQTKLSLRYNTVYNSIQRIYYIHLNHFGERDKRTLTDVVKLKTIIEAYEKIRNQKIITLLDERECAMCGAKFHPAC